MSHNINEERMFYHGATPWHGIGVELNHPATAKEAIEAARLDYQVELKPLYVEVDGDLLEIPNKKSAVRIDTSAPLGIIGNRYQIIQNTEAFSFFDNVVGEGQAIYHTAGALGLGERIWILAKLPNDIIVANSENIEKYLCLTNSHDGSTALRLYFTPIRVVCQNTLIMSLSNKSDSISIRHCGNIKSKVSEAQRILGISIAYYDDFKLIAERLAGIKINKLQVESYFDNLLKIENQKEEDVSTQIKNRKNDLLVLFERGKGNDAPNIKHSAWAAYNAVTEYVDWMRTPKGLAKDPTNRLKNIWFGTGAELKSRAFTEIQKSII